MRSIASIIVLYFTFLGSCFAQGVTTGTLSGKISEVGTKKPLQGATIVAIHVPTGSKYGAIARKGGSYTIRGMRVGGPYSVTVSFVGYQTSRHDGITISLGETRDLDVLLSQKDKVSEAVVVTAEKDRVFNENKTGSSSTISESEIAASPSINRSISDIARVNPYASQTSTFGGDDGLQGISIAGVNSRFNSVQIDGAVANDVFGLSTAGTPGGQANANTLSLDAIQELQVNVSPYDIRQSGFTGGLVNAITRGGTNKFIGSVFSYGRNEDLVGNSPDALKLKFSKFRDFQFGGRIGGPIVENELFFHVTTEVRLRNRPLEIAFNNPTALNNFAHNQSEVDDIIKVAKEKFNYDAGTSDAFISRNNSYNVIARLDWNINPDNKIQLRHNYTNAFQDRNVQRTIQIFSTPSQWNEFRSINNSTVIQWNSLVADNMSNELRVSYNVTNDVRANQYGDFPQVKVYVGGSNDYVLIGPERNSQANSLDQTQVALTNDFSYFYDNHTFTIGTHNELYKFNNLFIQDYYGQYSFRDVSAFSDSTPSFYQLSYANTNATNGEIKPRAVWSMLQTSLYLMDEWKVSPTLRLTFGVRADVPIYLSTPLENSLFKSKFDTLANRYNMLSESAKLLSTPIPSGMSTSVLPDPKYLWSPRLGFNFDVNGDKTFILRGGTGLFTGKVAAVWLSNQFGNTGVDFYRIRVGSDSPAGNPLNGLQGVLKTSLNANKPLKPGDGIFSGNNESTTSVNITDNNFKSPQVWRSTFGTDIKLTDGISITIEGMYGVMLNQIDYKNLNLRRSLALPNNKVDGRPIYTNNQVGTDSNNAREFTDVIYLSSRSEGYQYNLMTTLNLSEKNPYISGLSGMFSYVYGRTYDLSDATAFTAGSNWNSTDSYDPNNLTVGRSSFDIPHRFVANLMYKLELIDNAPTTLGIFYSGNSGRPYGFTYNGDINGDGITHNDLVYIPKQEDFNTKVVIVPPTESSELRTAEQIWQQMMAFIDANPVLKSYQGKVLERNAMREPFIHQLDFRVAQKVNLNKHQSIEITLDVQNMLNLLSSDWGLQKYVNFQSNNTVFIARTVNSRELPYDNLGRLKISFSSPVTNGQQGIYTTDNFYSRWRMQLGFRINF